MVNDSTLIELLLSCFSFVIISLSIISTDLRESSSNTNPPICSFCRTSYASTSLFDSFSELFSATTSIIDFSSTKSSFSIVCLQEYLHIYIFTYLHILPCSDQYGQWQHTHWVVVVMLLVRYHFIEHHKHRPSGVFVKHQSSDLFFLSHKLCLDLFVWFFFRVILSYYVYNWLFVY
jgi:hypothetical protein